MLFILSTGRAGSKSIAQLLSTIHGCTCFHEPEPTMVVESSNYRYGNFSSIEIATMLENTRSSHINGEMYCESNQTLSLIIPVLAKTFPQARFLWLIRNGLDMVASGYSKQWYSGHSENHDRYEDCPPWEQIWIDGRIRGDFCGDVPREKWAQMDRFSRVCWYWSYVNRLIETDLQKYAKDRFKLVRLEMLSKRLPEILDWLKLQTAILPAPKRVNVGKRAPFPWQTWSEEHRQVFEVWCLTLMNNFYPEWRDKYGVWQGVSSIQPKSPISYMLNNYTLVKKINWLLARNSIK